MKERNFITANAEAQDYDLWTLLVCFGPVADFLVYNSQNGKYPMKVGKTKQNRSSVLQLFFLIYGFRKVC